jgi:hypothetical protein
MNETIRFVRDKMENVTTTGISNVGVLAGDAHFFDDTTTPSKLKEFLDSQKEAEKLKGMKLLLAMMSKGTAIPEFFPDVVKNIVAKSIGKCCIPSTVVIV